MLLAGLLALTGIPTHADQFGTPGHEFTIDFVPVGNPGNADDAGGGGGTVSSPFGEVPYE
jgi:hypothetical protein